MEAPTTSVTETATMIAPKRSVMIDDPARAITHTADPAAGAADPASKAAAHPSQPPAAEGGKRRRTLSRLIARPARKHASITCSTCRITYLPSALPPPSTPPHARVCDSCQQTLG